MLARGLSGRLSAQVLGQSATTSLTTARYSYAFQHTHTLKYRAPASWRSYAAQARTPAKPKAGSNKGKAKAAPRVKAAAAKEPAARKPAVKKSVAKNSVSKKTPEQVARAEERESKKTLREQEKKSRAKVKAEQAKLRQKKKTAADAAKQDYKIALLSPEDKKPASKAKSAWAIFLSRQVIKGSTALGAKGVTQVIPEVASRYRNLTPAEREELNHEAAQNVVDNKTTYKAWVEKHTPRQIYDANLARARIHARNVARYKAHGGRKPVQMNSIHDERLPKRNRTNFVIFVQARLEAGRDDFKGIDNQEVMKLIGNEWNQLSETAKKPYEDAAIAERARYEEEHLKVFGVPTYSRVRADIKEAATA